MAGPMADVTVLDLTVGVAGPYATKLLADYGADVIKVEPPGGDHTRTLGPFPGGIPDREKSGTFFFFNTNKRSVVLDLKSEASRAAFWALIDRADIVVESFRPGVLDRLGVAWEAIHARKPSLALVSVTNFGQESPYRDYKGTELTLYGFAGEMYTMGVAEREPVKMYGTAGLVESGAAAATAIMGALFVSARQGIGQHVDFAIADSQFGGADRRHATAIAYEFSGRRTNRAPSGSRAILRGVYPCADGYVEFSAAAARVDRLSEMLGHPEWLADPKWHVPGAMIRPDLVEEFEGNFYPWLYDHTKREIWAKAREARVLCGPLFTLDEIAADEHFRARGFWTKVDHPALGTVEIPGRPFVMPASPWEIRRPAPFLGEHTAEVLSEAGLSAAAIDQVTSRAATVTA
ncbi:MAG: CaiB/BaiF CoA transferase family protein [Dehalococcoidia bacterium]